MSHVTMIYLYAIWYYTCYILLDVLYSSLAHVNTVYLYKRVLYLLRTVYILYSVVGLRYYGYTYTEEELCFF